jgi:hypothetical protein
MNHNLADTLKGQKEDDPVAWAQKYKKGRETMKRKQTKNPGHMARLDKKRSDTRANSLIVKMQPILDEILRLKYPNAKDTTEGQGKYSRLIQGMLSKTAIACCLKRPFSFVPVLGWIDNLKNHLKKIEVVPLMDMILDWQLAKWKIV